MAQSQLTFGYLYRTQCRLYLLYSKDSNPLPIYLDLTFLVEFDLLLSTLLTGRALDVWLTHSWVVWVLCVCACGCIQTQEPHRNPITLPEWLICALWNIVEYQAYFMIQPSAGSLSFHPASGFICEAKPVWPSVLPSLFSRIFKHRILDF